MASVETLKLDLSALPLVTALLSTPPQGSGGGSGLSRNVGEDASTRPRAFSRKDQGRNTEKEEAIAAEAIGRECVGRRRLVRVESNDTDQKCIPPTCCATSPGLLSLLIDFMHYMSRIERFSTLYRRY